MTYLKILGLREYEILEREFKEYQRMESIPRKRIRLQGETWEIADGKPLYGETVLLIGGAQSIHQLAEVALNTKKLITQRAKTILVYIPCLGIKRNYENPSEGEEEILFPQNEILLEEIQENFIRNLPDRSQCFTLGPTNFQDVTSLNPLPELFYHLKSQSLPRHQWELVALSKEDQWMQNHLQKETDSTQNVQEERPKLAALLSTYPPTKEEALAFAKDHSDAKARIILSIHGTWKKETLFELATSGEFQNIAFSDSIASNLRMAPIFETLPISILNTCERKIEVLENF